MGIYGALATAVTGMRAQSFALENISGNIANSQTTGYKRLETGFIDLIPDAAVGRQVPGAVLAYSRSTNDVRGDIVTSPTGTHVALNGSGFFVVSEKTGTTDGQSVFGDANFYTRRGDFELDREGYLVNGAGYYLKGVPVDSTTGNVTGSVPQMIRVSNGLIPAQATSRINYQLNLPAEPAVGIAGARAIANAGPGLSGTSSLGDDGDEFRIAFGGTEHIFVVGDDDDGTTLQDLVDWLDDLSGVTASLSSSGRLTISSNAVDQAIEMSGAVAELLDLDDTHNPIAVHDQSDFVERSVEGGAVTVYAPNGASAHVQMRWAKLDDDPDTWQLYYQSGGGTQGWEPISEGLFTFNSDGTLATMAGDAVSGEDNLRLNIEGLSINGTTVGDVEINFGRGGLTQFDNASGRASDQQVSQNGYAAGSFMSVAINDSGRVVATYSNGQQIDIFQLMTANFNAENMLKRMDGGIFAATAESGEAILSTDGGLTGGALETSNTDISEEFTKLIVTQQAYAAGTRIVSTSDEMLREALNMIR